MGYHEALEAAGAKVHVFEHFGDWQGSWYAKVTYSGKTGWVHGAFGSCSGCDAFQAEFDFVSYDEQDSEEYKRRLAEFGRSYLNYIESSEKILYNLNKDRDWDMGVDPIIDFITKNSESN